jgi:cytidine deaminase
MLTEEQRQYLIQVARNTRRWAYAPYSNYPVGAALLTTSGRIYDGVNIENAAYPNGICAERVAVFKAVSEGELQFEALVVATHNGGTPCGACRQVLAEFGTGTLVLIVDETGKILQETSVQELLPSAFGPGDLNQSSIKG